MLDLCAVKYLWPGFMTVGGSRHRPFSANLSIRCGGKRFRRIEMASVFSHGFVAVAIGTFQPLPIRTTRFLVLSIFCAIVPDLDVIGYFAGIEYGDLFGHRGMTHSLLFAFLLALVVVRYGFSEYSSRSAGWWGLLLHFFLVTASHGVLDAMTNGGRGVAFFAPFDETRYFFPWRPVKVSPIGISSFFSLTGLLVLLSEAVFIWLPTWVFVKSFQRVGQWRVQRRQAPSMPPI